jgi:very-short-patch-repair endonuclease
MQANQENHQAYNNYLQPVANNLRHHSTNAEIHLWKHVLRAGQMMGYTFRRQRPVLHYVADFMCQPLRLIIELDGSVHKEDGVAAKDDRRQADLEAAGFTILRFYNQDAVYQTAMVRKSIEGWIECYEGANGLPEHAARVKSLRGL